MTTVPTVQQGAVPSNTSQSIVSDADLQFILQSIQELQQFKREVTKYLDTIARETGVAVPTFLSNVSTAKKGYDESSDNDEQDSSSIHESGSCSSVSTAVEKIILGAQTTTICHKDDSPQESIDRAVIDSCVDTMNSNMATAENEAIITSDNNDYYRNGPETSLGNQEDDSPGDNIDRAFINGCFDTENYDVVTTENETIIASDNNDYCRNGSEISLGNQEDECYHHASIKKIPHQHETNTQSADDHSAKKSELAEILASDNNYVVKSSVFKDSSHRLLFMDVVNISNGRYHRVTCWDRIYAIIILGVQFVSYFFLAYLITSEGEIAREAWRNPTLEIPSQYCYRSYGYNMANSLANPELCELIRAFEEDNKLFCTEQCSDYYKTCTNDGEIVEMPMPKGELCYDPDAGDCSSGAQFYNSIFESPITTDDLLGLLQCSQSDDDEMLEGQGFNTYWLYYLQYYVGLALLMGFLLPDFLGAYVLLKCKGWRTKLTSLIIATKAFVAVSVSLVGGFLVEEIGYFESFFFIVGTYFIHELDEKSGRFRNILHQVNQSYCWIELQFWVFMISAFALYLYLCARPLIVFSGSQG